MVSLGGRRGRRPAGPAGEADSRTQPAVDSAVWAIAAGQDTLLHLHVQPGAKRSAVLGEHGRRLKVAVKAPPVEGKANATLVQFLSELLQRPRRSISIESGLAHREKTVRIEAAAPAEIVPAVVSALRRPAP